VKQLKTFSIPYGSDTLEFDLPSEQVIFDGALPETQALPDLEAALRQRLAAPIGCSPLAEMVRPTDRVLILIEDATRSTPVQRILPVLVETLQAAGVPLENIELLTAPGTHRVMTEAELLDKVGADMLAKLKVSQHDYQDESSMLDFPAIEVAGLEIPIQVNRKVSEADFIIGIGNIVPHSDAGFSGGAKILQPGVCGYPTTAATHLSSALLDEIPLGQVENPCRLGMEEVARRMGLKFIINTVKNYREEVIEIVAGDMVAAHRQGAKLAAQAFAVPLPALADIVIVSSNPADLDFWQAGKGLTAAYFAVKSGGTIIWASPCSEGLAHNHPRFAHWLDLSHAEILAEARGASLTDRSVDLVSAVLAACNSRAREKAQVLAISDGLSDEEMGVLGFTACPSLQAAVDRALPLNPDATIGLLPRGGDCLPQYR
jgi:nickel-dependent lactate racemase